MSKPRILITGAGGMLAQALQQAMAAEGLEVSALGRAELDVTDCGRVRATMAELRPGIVIQGAAFTRVDDAEVETAEALAVNGEATRHVAAACNEFGARFVYPSTDYVFDGRARRRYPVAAPTGPVNAYGRSKLAGEVAAREAGDFLIIRSSWLYGAGGRNFVRTVAARLKAGAPLRVVHDQVGAPTWTADLARTIYALLAIRAPAGIYHVSNSGSGSWYDVACETARLLGVPENIEPCTTDEYPTRAQRPAYSVLDCSQTVRLTGPLRNWRHALAEAIATGNY